MGEGSDEAVGHQRKEVFLLPVMTKMQGRLMVL